MNTGYAFDWADLAFGSKKPLKELKAVFIAAPREISDARFKQLIKQYLPHGNIVVGTAKEPYVFGFEEQPQFRMLQKSTIQKTIDRVNAASKQQHIYILEYAQRELPYILEKIAFKRVLFVNGSWHYVFHTSPAYYALAAARTPYEMISPFMNEEEAREYENDRMEEIALAHHFKRGTHTEKEMLEIAKEAAMFSFDYSFQTGVAVGKKTDDNYKLLVWAYNKVVPYQTHAMHHGASREKYFSPPNDLNHYDTVHAEVMAIVSAGKTPINLKGATMFINLMPCPTCARMLSETDIEEFVYSIDHSDGYAVKLLEAAGKKVRRVVL